MNVEETDEAANLSSYNVCVKYTFVSIDKTCLNLSCGQKYHLMR